MQLASDPAIATKIRKMKQRVRWRDPLIVGRGIDQTHMVLDDGESDNPEFSFLVIGDTGSGSHREHNPQRKIAEEMQVHRDSCRFVLHTGDVVYLVGASEYYPQNFIQPYQSFLVGGDRADTLSHDQLVFSKPILPVPGNHDYYDLPLFYGVLTGLTKPLRRFLRSGMDFDMGWRGSSQGKAYAQAFLDFLCRFNNRDELAHHLDQHYTAHSSAGRCLRYQPGQFTRLPNRYYTFRTGGIDFFALDSNTFNAPAPIPATHEGDIQRRQLEARRDEIERQKFEIMERAALLNPDSPDDCEQLDDLHDKLEQLDEVKMDISKQLDAHQIPDVDLEQLDWLKDQLIESWHTDEVRGRIIYLHHPPYVTEATKWYQAQTLAIRHHLRQVLNAVAKEVGELPQDRPLVDLILSGHAHCMDYLRTLNTGHADAYLNWIVCGGSGFSLRRQRQEGIELMEPVQEGDTTVDRAIARSLLFVGRTGHGSQKRRPYSFLRIDVQGDRVPKFVIQPFVSERYQHDWHDYPIKPFVI